MRDQHAVQLIGHGGGASGSSADGASGDVGGGGSVDGGGSEGQCVDVL